MRSEEFVAVIRLVVRDAAIRNTLSVLDSPPGRRPRQDLVEASAFFHELSPDERDVLRLIVTESVDSTIFNFLSVLDGVLAIESSPTKGTIELRYVRDGIASALNPPGGSFLHEIYNAK